MNEWDLYRVMVVSTLLMLSVVLLLYIYSYCRVRGGSGLTDVKLIIILLIVSSLAGIATISTQYFMARCPEDYSQFSYATQQNIAKDLNLVSFSLSSRLARRAVPILQPSHRLHYRSDAERHNLFGRTLVLLTEVPEQQSANACIVRRQARLYWRHRAG